MRKLLRAFAALAGLLIYAQTADAQNLNWTRISPLEYCPEFKLEYSVNSDGQYQLRIPGPVAPEYLDQKLEDVNDFSLITDILVEKSLPVCNVSKAPARIEEGFILFEQEADFGSQVCREPIRYTEPYVELARELVSILQFSGNRCDQLMSYTKLQTQIEQLSDEELISIDDPGGLFHQAIAIFTPPETDKMLELYNSCGGKKFTDKFVANLIMLEAKKACVMPRPPGMMSFEETKKIAQDIAKDYNNLSLLAINKKQDEITQKAVMAFVDGALKSEIQGMLGNQIEDLDAFIGELDTVKEIRSVKLSEVGDDYLGLGFTMDATLEIAQKALPLLARSSFQERLPSGWSSQKKKTYFENSLMPKIEDQYNVCMQEHKDKVLFGKGASIEKKLKARAKLKKRYCQNHPDQCQKNTCGNKVSVLSGDPEISDAKVVQGCAMKALLNGVKPLLRESIADQKESFKKDFTLTDEMVEESTETTWKGLLNCANRQVLKANGETATSYSDPLSPPIFTEDRHLQKVSAADFEATIIDCADVATVDVARDFFKKTLMSQDVLSNEYPDSLTSEVDAIIGETYDSCIYAQQFNQVLEGVERPKRNPLLCVPIVEMEAAKRVITSTLLKTIKEAGADTGSSPTQLTIKEFENCADAAMESAQEGIGTSSAAIPNQAAAQSYLEKDAKFVGCVKDAVLNTVEVAGSEIFDREIDSMADQLKAPEYVRGLKNGALIQTQQCFKDGLSEIENWRQFVAFNDAKGLNTTMEKCEAVALDYILPKALIRETSIQLADLKNESLIKNNTEVGNILAYVAYDLRKRYGLDLPNNVKGDDIIEWSFAKAHNAHLKKEGASTNTFVKEYGDLAMEKAIGVVFKNVKADVQKIAGNQYNDFFEAIGPQCLYNGFSKFQGDIIGLIEKMAKMPANPEKESTIREISKAIVDGLSYQKGLGGYAYSSKLKDIKSLCSNVKGLDDPKDVAKTNALDFVIKGALKKTLLDSFYDIAKDQCVDDLRKSAPNSFEGLIQKACAERNPIKAANYFSSILIKAPVSQDADAQRNIGFVQERLLEMGKLLRDTMEKTSFIERSVFGDPSIMKFIYDNFTPVMTENKSVMNQLTAKIAKRVFSDQSNGGFADRFAKTQLEAGFGLAGYEKAYATITIEKLDESLGWLDIFVSKNKALKVSREALRKKWTPKGISGMLDWNRISHTQRKKLMNALYSGAIEPSLSGGSANMDKISDELGKHASDYKYPGSNKSFEEKLTEYITEYVEDKKWSILGV